LCKLAANYTPRNADVTGCSGVTKLHLALFTQCQQNNSQYKYANMHMNYAYEYANMHTKSRRV